MRVADYPTIQDYVGQAVMETNASRLFVFSVAQAFDNATDNNTKLLEPGELARGNFLHWAWQIKFVAAQNTAHVVDKMLHACGGSGYKRDMSRRTVEFLANEQKDWFFHCHLLYHMSTLIAFPGTLKRFNLPSCFTVIPSREMPYSARPPSAVAVFIEMMKLMHRQMRKKSESLVEPTILSIASVYA